MPDGVGLSQGCDIPPPHSGHHLAVPVDHDSPRTPRPWVIPHVGPIYPQYSTYQARLASYREWPPGLRQTKEEMAAAGLYYYGVSDQVKCFYCDGGLREWQEEDDPWVEHAGWFQECAYVRLVRGDEFVNECVEFVRNVVQTRRAEMAKKKIQEDTCGLERCNSFSSTESSSSSSSDEALIRENQRMKDQRQCKVCFDAEVGVVFLPCAHLAVCRNCAPGLTKCVVCMSNINETIRVYMS